MKSVMKLLVWVVVIGALVAGGWTWYARRGQEPTVVYRTEPVKRGTLTSSISATGTVEPEEVVDVGAQVTGQILSFGTDANGKTIDYTSPVEKGTVLARIDDSLYAADVANTKASLELAKAGVVRAQADLNQSKAKLYQAQRDWERAQKLGPSDALAQSAYDGYKSAYETAQAAVGVSQASIAQADAQVSQAQAAYDRAMRNESYCTIISPVKGVIIDRRVNIGQTVTASLNAPSLFLLAKDLTKMQVWVAVNEADIGNIHPGQVVTFTIDAYPGRTFKGSVGKVRLNAQMTQNVVTYTVEVLTDNSDSTLLPYQTANVQFQVDRKDSVLIVPNAALRWLPSEQEVAPDVRAEMASSDTGGGEGSGEAGGSHAHSGGHKKSGSAPQVRHGMVWVQDGLYVRPLSVTLGITDGTNTEVRSDKLAENSPVIVGEEVAGADGAASGDNPFAPHFFHRGRKK